MAMGDDFDRDILDIIPERFDADPDSRQARAGHRLRTVITLVVAVAAVGGLVAGGWHFLGDRPVGGPGIPVIKADDRPIKTRPDERGGMQVPNQDKLVYERMEAGEGDARVERLLPPPEQPQVPPRAAEPPAPAPATPTTEILRPPAPAAKPGEPPAPKAAPPQPVTAQPLPPPVAPAPQPIAPQPIAPQPVPAAPAYQPTQSRQPAPQVAAVPAPAPGPAKAPPPSGDFLIQLGALRAQDAAEREWARIQKSNSDLLGGLKPDIVRVDLGEKGTFWRLRAGPLTEQAARGLCGQLKERNQGCIIARK